MYKRKFWFPLIFVCMVLFMGFLEVSALPENNATLSASSSLANEIAGASNQEEMDSSGIPSGPQSDTLYKYAGAGSYKYQLIIALIVLIILIAAFISVWKSKRFLNK